METITRVAHLTTQDLVQWVARRRTDLHDDRLLHSAIEIAVEAHRGQLRASGDEAVTHPLSVARRLAVEGSASDVIAAGVLHDVVEDTNVTLHELTAITTPRVGAMVFLLTKPSEHTEPPIMGLAPTLDLNADEMTLSALAIKLSDRLHNLWTAGSLSPWRQRRMAWETLDILYPAAKRLGSPNTGALRVLSRRILESHQLPIAA
jgi:GTP diphosphokinase / guanosine-3',5'-bis(diphosphate) 3'-diphosphatase